MVNTRMNGLDQMMVRVQDLMGGDVVKGGVREATFIGSSQHPGYPGLALVVWRMSDGAFSYDALSWEQVVGTVNRMGRVGWMQRLKKAVGDES